MNFSKLAAFLWCAVTIQRHRRARLGRHAPHQWTGERPCGRIVAEPLLAGVCLIFDLKLEVDLLVLSQGTEDKDIRTSLLSVHHELKPQRLGLSEVVVTGPRPRYEYVKLELHFLKRL